MKCDLIDCSFFCIACLVAGERLCRPFSGVFSAALQVCLTFAFEAGDWCSMCLSRFVQVLY